MSESSVPIPPDLFRKAITDLDLEQLHLEASRLRNSIYHLKRSNVSLEEFSDDETCKAAIIENEEVIAHQEDRIRMITEEVEGRGFKMGHGGEEKKDGGDVTNTQDAPGQVANGENAAATGNEAQEESGVYL